VIALQSLQQKLRRPQLKPLPQLLLRPQLRPLQKKHQQLKQNNSHLCPSVADGIFCEGNIEKGTPSGVPFSFWNLNSCT
jgi:hypothetical protein